VSQKQPVNILNPSSHSQFLTQNEEQIVIYIPFLEVMVFHVLNTHTVACIKHLLTSKIY